MWTNSRSVDSKKGSVIWEYVNDSSGCEKRDNYITYEPYGKAYPRDQVNLTNVQVCNPMCQRVMIFHTPCRGKRSPHNQAAVVVQTKKEGKVATMVSKYQIGG
jgi:hypothetical protein